MDRWPRVAVIAVFFVQGFLFASWTAHIPQLKHHLGLSDGRLGLVLLGAPLGSVLALVVAGRILSSVGSRPVVRLALLGYCVSGPFIGLTSSFGTFFVAFLVWGFFQGMLDVSMNTQAIAVERFSGRVLMPGFHGSWSSGALGGAVVGAAAVGLGVSLSEQLLVLAIPCLLVVGWLTTQMIPDQRPGDEPESSTSLGEGRHGMLQRQLIVLGGIAFADMLCEGAVADWAAVYLHDSLRSVPLVAGMGFALYALAMLVVRLCGNRLFTRFAAHRLLPLLAVIATLGFAGGLVIARPVSVLVGFALLGAGLACVVPMALSAAGAVGNVDTGKAVASVAGFGWAGFVAGPVVIGAIASSTTLRTALFLIPVLTGIVAVGTWTAKGVRRLPLPAGEVPNAHPGEPAVSASQAEA
ncbi:MAG TPA: MFS transporter [Acidimicrobiales bacterium]|jgi:MFS family permease|nr:MFS transporter [Acidimicrobiales bacterium]